MTSQFDKFTECARRVLIAAEAEAKRFNEGLETEHLLLGLLGGGGVAGKILTNAGLDLMNVRTTVLEAMARHDRPIPKEPGLTPRSQKVIALAVEEARRLNHSYIGSEHLLLGLILAGDGLAFSVLDSLGISLDRARTEMDRVYGEVLPDRQGRAPDDVLSGENSAEAAMPTRDPSAALRGSTTPEATERFDKFTGRARRVLTYAQEEAQRFNQTYIGTEHLLLGLLREPNGVGCVVLTDLGVDLGVATTAVEQAIGRGETPASMGIGLTEGAKHVIELAVEEARRLNHSHIGSEHLVLGLTRERQGIAYGVLDSMGVTADRARTQTRRVLSQRSSDEQRAIEQRSRRPMATNIVGAAEFDTDVRSPADMGELRTAPNTDLALTAIRLLRAAQSMVESLSQDVLAQRLLNELVAVELARAASLLGLQTFNQQELDDTLQRLRHSIDILNSASVALQQTHPDAALILMEASIAVQRALAR